MRHNVEVRTILLTDGEVSLSHANLAEMPESLQQAETAVEIEKERKASSKNVLDGFSSLGLNKESLKVSKGSFSDLETKLRGVQDYSNCSAQSIVRTPELLAEGTADIGSSKESSQEIPMQRIE